MDGLRNAGGRFWREGLLCWVLQQNLVLKTFLRKIIFQTPEHFRSEGTRQPSEAFVAANHYLIYGGVSKILLVTSMSNNNESKPTTQTEHSPASLHPENTTLGTFKMQIRKDPNRPSLSRSSSPNKRMKGTGFALHFRTQLLPQPLSDVAGKRLLEDLGSSSKPFSSHKKSASWTPSPGVLGVPLNWEEISSGAACQGGNNVIWLILFQNILKTAKNGQLWQVLPRNQAINRAIKYQSCTSPATGKKPAGSPTSNHY